MTLPEFDAEEQHLEGRDRFSWLEAWPARSASTWVEDRDLRTCALDVVEPRIEGKRDIRS